MYGIVKQAGGYIDVESNPGGGSVFRIYLPALKEATAEAPSEPNAVTASAAGPRRSCSSRTSPPCACSRSAPCRSMATASLASAILWLALDAATGDPGAFDALVTDVVMPAMSGPALAERIAAIRPGLPVLFMSGYEAGSLPAGAPRPLAKPFSACDLADAVGALFGRSRLRSTLD